MRRFAALLIACAPMLALAQDVLQTQTNINFTYGGSNEFRFRESSCSGASASIDVTWQVPTLFLSQLCGPLRVWVTSGSCGAEPKDGDLVLDPIAQSLLGAGQTGLIPLDLPELPALLATGTADGGINPGCGALGVEKTSTVCGSALSTTGFSGCISTTALQAASLKLVYDTQPPAAPNLEKLEVQDGIIRASYSAAAGTSTLYAEVRAEGAAEVQARITDTALTGTVRLGNLTNGVPYAVRLQAEDAAGNLGPFSAALTATPVESFGFWSSYRRGGGAEPGGCSAAAGLLPWLSVSVLVLVSARRKRP